MATILTYFLSQQILFIPFDHDENHFLAAAYLVNKGLLPYKDFPYNHTPLYPYIASLFYKISSYKFLTLRILAGISFLLISIIIFWQLYKKSIFLAIISLGTIIFSKIIVFNTCLVRPNNLALLAAILAFYLAIRPRKLSFFVGILLSIATDIRITYALLFIPFRFLIDEGREIKKFYLGTILGAIPVIFFFIKYPLNFTFHTIVQPIKRKSFYIFMGYKEYLGIDGRIKSIYNAIKLSPDLGLILILAISIAFATKIETKQKIFMILTILTIAIQCILPAPVWYQYLIPLYIFCIIILAELYPINILKILMTFCLIINLYLTGPWYWYTSKLNFSQSVPQRIHDIGKFLSHLAGGEGKVLTLSTAFPIEASLDIYRKVPSVFPWREAIFLDKSLRKKYILYGPEELEEITNRDMPKLVLTGLENPWLEKPINRWAKKHNCKLIKLENLKIWLITKHEK